MHTIRTRDGERRAHSAIDRSKLNARRSSTDDVTRLLLAKRFDESSSLDETYLVDVIDGVRRPDG